MDMFLYYRCVVISNYDKCFFEISLKIIYINRWFIGSRNRVLSNIFKVFLEIIWIIISIVFKGFKLSGGFFLIDFLDIINKFMIIKIC